MWVLNLQFENSKNKVTILKGGPWFYQNTMPMLNPWCDSFYLGLALTDEIYLILTRELMVEHYDNKMGHTIFLQVFKGGVWKRSGKIKTSCWVKGGVCIIGVSRGINKGQGELSLPPIATPSIPPLKVLEGIKLSVICESSQRS